MAARKKISVQEYYDKNNKKFISFANSFADTLCNETIISALAEKDLEKLAKVWKLVMEMLADNSSENSTDKLAELIESYSQLTVDS